MSISMIGLDTAKTVFQIHSADETGRAEIRRKLRRNGDREVFPCRVR